MLKKRWIAWILIAAMAAGSIGQTGVLAEETLIIESAEETFSTEETAAESAAAETGDTQETGIDADQPAEEAGSESAEISGEADSSDSLGGASDAVTEETAEAAGSEPAEISGEADSSDGLGGASDAVTEETGETAGSSVEFETEAENSAEANGIEIISVEEITDEPETGSDEILVADGEEVSVAATSSTSYTSGDYTYTVDGSGNAAITDYTGSASALSIPSTIDGYTVTGIGAQAFLGCSSLTSLTIPETVTFLGYQRAKGDLVDQQ